MADARPVAQVLSRPAPDRTVRSRAGAPAPFAMAVDRRHPAIVLFRVWGLWDLQDAHRFGAEARALIAALPVPFGRHSTCMDITGFKIQPQIVVKACLAMVMEGIVGQRSAFVVGDGLARIQVKRVTGSVNIRTFDDPVAARAWLIGPHATPAA